MNIASVFVSSFTLQKFKTLMLELNNIYGFIDIDSNSKKRD